MPTGSSTASVVTPRKVLAAILAGRPTEIRGYHARLARLKGADKIKVA